MKRITSKAKIEVTRDSEGRISAVVTSIGGGVDEWGLMREVTAVLKTHYEAANALIQGVPADVI